MRLLWSEPRLRQGRLLSCANCFHVPLPVLQETQYLQGFLLREGLSFMAMALIRYGSTQMKRG